MFVIFTACVAITDNFTATLKAAAACLFFSLSGNGFFTAIRTHFAISVAAWPEFENLLFNSLATATKPKTEVTEVIEPSYGDPPEHPPLIRHFYWLSGWRPSGTPPPYPAFPLDVKGNGEPPAHKFRLFRRYLYVVGSPSLIVHMNN